MGPGFSERTFEFCFNAEFCQLFGGLLASHPHIPSQREEKDLGYDVEFVIRHTRPTAPIHSFIPKFENSRKHSPAARNVLRSSENRRLMNSMSTR